jgi:hypothetical protein
MKPPRDEPRQEADDDRPDDTHSALPSQFVGPASCSRVTLT